MAKIPGKVHLALLAAQLAFAGFAVIGKAVLEHLHPLAVASMRILVSTPLLLLTAWITERRLPTRRDVPHLILLGFLGVFTNQVLFVLGLEKTTATNASILMPSIPVFAVAVGALLRIEPLDRRKLFGVALSVAGALVLLRPTRFSFTNDTAFGNLLILVNCLSYASFLVLQRPLLRRLPPLTVIAWSFLFGGMGTLAVGFPWLRAVDVSAIPGWVWWGLAYVVIVPSGVSHAIMTWGVHRSTPGVVATYTTVQPVFATLLAVAFLAEGVGWREVAGFALIVSGLVQTSRSPAPGAAAAT